MPESVLDNISIDVEEAERTAKSVQTGELRSIAEAFFRNADDLLGLLSLPLVLLTVGTSAVHRLVFFTQALVSTKNVERWDKSAEARAEVEAEVRRLAEAAHKDPDSTFKPVDEAKVQLAHLLGHRELDAPARALLYAGCSSAWAAFECAAKDAWIAAVNARPLKLAQPAFTKVSDDPPPEGLTAKQVSVALMARHGFDLRDKLGTLLAPKFDFTGVAGIRGAYGAAFGVRPEFSEPLSDPILATLEATRHLIVHRAGLVDEEYRRRTGDTTRTGQLLQLNGTRVSQLCNAAVASGCKLLLAVDTWLVQNPPTAS